MSHWLGLRQHMRSLVLLAARLIPKLPSSARGKKRNSQLDPPPAPDHQFAAWAVRSHPQQIRRQGRRRGSTTAAWRQPWVLRHFTRSVGGVESIDRSIQRRRDLTDVS